MTPHLGPRHCGALLVGLLASCEPGTGLPDVGSPAYAEAVGAFCKGVAAVQVGANDLAETVLERVTELAPGEPAGWVDLAIVALQRRDVERADERLSRARAGRPSGRASPSRAAPDQHGGLLGSDRLGSRSAR